MHPALHYHPDDSPPPPAARDLADWLLAHGGRDVLWQPLHPHLLTRLLADGQVADRAVLRVARGQARACHANTARLAVAGLTVVTGWARAGGQATWVPHSWGHDGAMIVETTVARLTYAGVVLSPAETVVFAANEGVLEDLVAADPARWLPVVADLARRGTVTAGSSWDVLA